MGIVPGWTIYEFPAFANTRTLGAIEMRYTLLTLLTAFLFLQSSLANGQDSSTAILSKQWLNVRNAQLNLSESIVEFCSVREIQNTYASSFNSLVSDAKRFSTEVKKVSSLDSGIVVYINTLQDSLLRCTITFIEQTQVNKILVKNSNVRTAGKKIEYMVEELGRQIHAFNYWVNEKNGWNIRFKDISL